MIKRYLNKILFGVVMLTISSVNAQTSTGTQTFSFDGYDDAPTGVTIDNPASFTVNQGQPMQSIIISDFYGSGYDDYDCGDWYGFSLILDGTSVITDGCASDFIGQDVSGVSSIVIVSSDLDYYSDYIMVSIDFEVEYDTPSCPQPINGVIDLFTSSSADLSWSAGGSETSWIVEWGLPGFSQGNGIGTQTVSSASVSIPGLSANTAYEVKIIADCGSGDESYPLTVSLLTACDAIPAISFCEGFEADSPTWNCWSIIDGNGDGYIYDDPIWGYTDYMWTVNNYDANTGLQSAFMYADYDDNDDYLVSPRLILTGNEVMTFSYMTEAGFKVLISTTGSDASDFTDELLSLATYTDYEYVETSIDLSAYSGEVYIAFYVNSTNYNYVYIDDVCIDICTPVAGIDGTLDVCRSEGTVDLSTVITSPYTHGEWKSITLQSLINNSEVTVSPLAEGTYTFAYIVTTACTSDTTLAVINVQNPSSAGENGLINACKNQMVDLFGALGGTIDAGGIWLNPSGNIVPSSYISTGTLVGQFVYIYVVENGVCDADTSEITLNVLDCNYLGLDDAELGQIGLYPNPTNGKFEITNAPSEGSYMVSDINGRIVVDMTNLTPSSTIVDLSMVENGIYLVRISGNNSEKIIRVVKQ